jgi:hypothetical protein
VDFLSRHNEPEVVAARTRAIYESVLRDSARLGQPNFERLGTDDLARLFELYDRHFFDGWLAPAVKAKTGAPLALRLSSTMTSAGGKTIQRRRRGPGGQVSVRFEIAIASRMLFMTFHDVARPVTVVGLLCRDRLEALQRIMEHELIHLTELLVWGKSSCARARFRGLAAGIFGHADTKHALVTPREYAAVRHGLSQGAAVQFEWGGRLLTGRINRIHHRATVLVADPAGVRYTDGKTYAKYYIPLGMLIPAMPRPSVE